ncbi:hypothetical protein CLF_107080 [Clonorchis sinensis]|uniref:Endonuclease/exonuclease/phosphatase domain-containing protein n=1 Tax=Clonorchis sinensis TaxID=79923 RepID=G7YG52_CLOSI|nr:hypothetical protein CLF_107080 [Clonorchis sinensis]
MGQKSANEKQPLKPLIGGADKYASEAPSEPPTQTRRKAIKSSNLTGYTTLGPSPSGAAEAALKCLSTNCLSLFNKLCDIKQSVSLKKPSSVALTETWLTPGVSDAEISIDGYSVFRADSRRGRAGGIALYLHAALPILIVPSDNAPAPLCDALWLQVPLRGSDSLLLGVVYRVPSSPPEDDHFLIRTLGQLSFSYHFTHLLLVGDFNAPKFPRTELQSVGFSGRFAAALTEVVQRSAWTQYVAAPTRYRAKQQPFLLDLVITNERHFIDRGIINAPLGYGNRCVLTFDFICYWIRNPNPKRGFKTSAMQTFHESASFSNKLNWDQLQWKNYLGPFSRKFTRLTRPRLFVPRNQHEVG